MTPRTKEQYARIREDRRKEILDAAMELFALKGYSQTTIQDIANKASISKGLLYNYFSSKDAIIEELFHQGLNLFYQYLDADNDGILSTEEMQYFLEKQIENLKKNPLFWKLFFMILIRPSSEKLLEKLRFEAYHSKMWMLVYSYMERHFTDKPDAHCWYFYAMMDGVFMHYAFSPDQYPIDEVLQIIIDQYCKPTIPQKQ
jgi:AcrR family transcriptional regulator